MATNAKCGRCGWTGDSEVAAEAAGPQDQYRCPRCHDDSIHLCPHVDVDWNDHRQEHGECIDCGEQL